MPSGSYGCASCGAPSETMIRIRTEDFLIEKDARGNRKRKVISTVNRTFCMDCAEEVLDALIHTLVRPRTSRSRAA